MLDVFFGFGLRIGRLRFFLLGVLLGFVSSLLLVSLAKFAQIQSTADLAAKAWFVYAALAAILIASLWTSLALYSMRIRDIGWDPIYIFSGWLVLVSFDILAGEFFPRLALNGRLSGTPVGALFHLGLNLVIMFWPGGGGEDNISPARPDEPPLPAHRNTPSETRTVSPASNSRQPAFGRLGR